MADRYWVGGIALGEWTPTNTAPWRSTPGASFSGTQSGFIVTFTDLKGTIAVGHHVYVEGYANTVISPSVITYTNSPTNTEGYFYSSVSRNISVRGMCAHSSNTGLSVPVAADSVFFTEGSAYYDQYIQQSIPSGQTVTITNLNMNGFRASILLGVYDDYYSLIVTGNITWPYETGAYVQALISLRSTTTINNNGNTDNGPGSFLEGINYSVNGFTPPENIIAGYLKFNGAVNLSNRTIRAFEILSDVGTSITAGTSKLICRVYESNSASARTLYDIEASVYGTVTQFIYSANATLTCNSITVPSTGEYTELLLNTVTLNKLNMQSPNVGASPFYSQFEGFPGRTVTKTGGGPVMLQVDEVRNVTFSPANTFFSVGKDFKVGFGNTNIRPSPNPLNFV